MAGPSRRQAGKPDRLDLGDTLTRLDFTAPMKVLWSEIRPFFMFQSVLENSTLYWGLDLVKRLCSCFGKNYDVGNVWQM